MKQVFATAPRFAGISGTFYIPVVRATSLGSEAPNSQIMPCAGTFRNLKGQRNAATGAGVTETVTLRVNGVNSALTITFTNAASTQLDNTHSVSVNAGDVVVFERTTSGTPAVSDATRIAIEFEPTSDNLYALLGCEGSPSTSTTQFANIVGDSGNGWSTTADAKHKSPCPHSTTINALYFNVSTAPGAGKSYRLSLVINNVEDTTTRVTISDANTSGNVTGLSIAVSQNDTVHVQCTPSGTPSASNARWGILFTPGTNGESWMPIGGNYSLSTTSTEYLDPFSYESNASTTEAADQSICGPTGFTVKKLTIFLGSAPGTAASGKSRTFRVRKNTANGSGNLTITETATTGNDNSNTDDYVEGDLISFSSVPTSTPASTTFAGAAVQFINPGGGGATDSFISKRLLRGLGV